jgi:hypothetical protein
MLKNKKLDLPTIFNKLEKITKEKNITYIPSSIPTSVSREKNRIRSIIFSNGFSNYKVRSKIFIDTSSMNFLSVLSNDKIKSIDSTTIPPIKYFSENNNKLKFIAPKNEHILTLSGCGRIETIKEIIKNENEGSVPKPDRFGISTPLTIDEKSFSDSSIHIHKSKQFNLSNHKSQRFWNLFYYGSATPLYRKDQFRDFSNRDLIISGLLSGATAYKIIQKKSSNPLIKTKQIENLLIN